VLSSQLGVPVENATMVMGSFDFTLQWRSDGVAAPDDGTRASLFTAIREQLGLRLDTRRMPVDVDGRRPSEPDADGELRTPNTNREARTWKCERPPSL
jgi:hypothetical protein